MDTTVEGKRVAVSGSGNVAQFAVEKLLQLGAVPVTMSDSGGTIYEPKGFTIEQLSQIMALKKSRGRLQGFEACLSPDGVRPAPAMCTAAMCTAVLGLIPLPCHLRRCSLLTAGSCAGKYLPDIKPWQVVERVDIALPCATQNEVDACDVEKLIKAGMKVLCEGANMPCRSEAIDALHEHKVEFGPAKAANAGAHRTSCRQWCGARRCAGTCEEHASDRVLRACK
jgi:glutamate dehydrogenase (NADP+)